ncbi:MAG: DUF1961 family protein [Planctomycetota bacterium]|jgi:hypothetical protein|nr:DUF1961 family protein [Planctomycetota bacterium]MDP7133176.1 DUF1961 family protein [Planctomycetota bacterium]MDP7252783.1 DUF1961 family protein [Planctomycetota bacterium]
MTDRQITTARNKHRISFIFSVLVFIGANGGRAEKGTAMKDKDLKASPYFKDDFSDGLKNWAVEEWETENEVQVGIRDVKLHVKTVSRVHGVMVWCKRKLPENFVVEYEVTPLSASGFFLIFFCYKGQDGKSILDETHFKDRDHPTLFKKYTKGRLDGYHISYRRNDAANCNFRKNSGQVLMKQHAIDKILPANRAVHVSLSKNGGRFILKVDGTVFMDFTDDRTRDGKIREGGHIGLRQVYESEGVYDNFRISELK